MVVQSLFRGVLLGCLVILVTANYDWTETEGRDLLQKKSLGDVCRCCTMQRDTSCCNACLLQYRSPTPFYTRKRSIFVKSVDKAQPSYPKRSRFRGRSRCGCCFTRRLRWCCDSCRRSYSGGYSKRSSFNDIELPFIADDPSISETSTYDSFPGIPETNDLERNQISRHLSDLTSIIETPLAKNTVREECLCCILYDSVQCCNRCQNAI